MQELLITRAAGDLLWKAGYESREEICEELSLTSSFKWHYNNLCKQQYHNHPVSSANCF
jgi:hypothetical protein